MDKIKELTDFYMWMKENDYDHNIRARVERKAEMCLNGIKVGQTLPIDSVMPSFDSPKNWTEDYKHENGNYICRCSKCKEYFYGHKRRPLCKECGS